MGDPFLIIMLAVLAFLIFSMFRRQRKAQAEAAQRKSSMEPGLEVMTSYGLYGRIVSINSDENKVVLELSPGNQATVHLQSVTKIIDPVEADPSMGAVAGASSDDLPADAPASAGSDVRTNGHFVGDDVVPDDASSLTGSGDRSVDKSAGSSRDETPEETMRRLNKPTENPDR